MSKFGKQGYFLNFPSKFISADGRTAWLSYSANFHKSYFGNRDGGRSDRAAATPGPSRRSSSWIRPRPRSLAAGTDKAPADPLKSEANIALRARVNVSSVHKKHRPFTELIEYFGEGAVDGVADAKGRDHSRRLGEPGRASRRP